eukprot:8563637-Pyramimonas_sp.AAC.2
MQQAQLSTGGGWRLHKEGGGQRQHKGNIPGRLRTTKEDEVHSGWARCDCNTDGRLAPQCLVHRARRSRG